MKIPGFIRRNFPLKLLSLVIAVAIYWIVSEDVKEERTVTLPVEVHLTQDLMMIQPQEFKVTVKVRGNKRDIDESVERIVCGVDVGFNDRRGDGSYGVTLSDKSFRTPGGVSVTRILSNPELILQLQRRVSRVLPVRMVFSGEVPNGFRVAESICLPNTVRVSGPESEIAELKEVQTELIPLDDRESGFEYETELRKPGGFELSPTRVKVNVGIERNVVTRDFLQVPVGLFYDSQSGIAARFNAETPPVALVRIVGASTDISRFRVNDMRLYIDVSGISTAGEYTLPVQCHIINRDGRIRETLISPANLKITVSKTPIKK